MKEVTEGQIMTLKPKFESLQVPALRLFDLDRDFHVPEEETHQMKGVEASCCCIPISDNQSIMIKAIPCFTEQKYMLKNIILQCVLHKLTQHCQQVLSQKDSNQT